MPDQSRITMDQLRIGLYVYLDLRWFEHPFPFGHFKIKTAEQLCAIRGLGLTSIRYDPAQSDPAVPSEAETPNPPQTLNASALIPRDWPPNRYSSNASRHNVRQLSVLKVLSSIQRRAFVTSTSKFFRIQSKQFATQRFWLIRLPSRFSAPKSWPFT